MTKGQSGVPEPRSHRTNLHIPCRTSRIGAPPKNVWITPDKPI